MSQRVKPNSCDNMFDESTLRLSIIAGSFFVVSLFASWYRRDPLVSLYHFVLLSSADRYQLEAIPVVGFSDPILSYFTALRFIFDGFSMLKQGYEKVNYSFFMITFSCAELMLKSGS